MKERIVRRIANFPPTFVPRRNNHGHHHDDDISNESVLDRVCLHGGQITFATIRFPPSSAITTTIDDDTYVGAGTEGVDVNAGSATGGGGEVPTIDKLNDINDDNDLLLSRNGGRVIFARGPWIESHPLIRKNGEHDAQQHNHVYKILAFGQGGGVGSSKLECVRGMIFPSSFSSSSSVAASIIAYGGRRISFLFGGGLWNNHQRSGSVEQKRTDYKDDFGCIPIRYNELHKDMRCCPYLEVSDWVHDISMLPIIPIIACSQRACSSSSSIGQGTTADANGRRTLEDEETESDTSCFLLAMGMANNSCEIWGFRQRLHLNPSGNNDMMILHPTRLQCITCDVRCMTYSLSFYGWDCGDVNSVWRVHTDGDGKSESRMSDAIPTLIAASGTVFGDVVVWSAMYDLSNTHVTSNDYLPSIIKDWLLANAVATNNTDTVHPRNGTLRIRVSPMNCLKGHLGSVLAVKFSSCGNFIASTSDDRTVRLWGKMPMKDIETMHVVSDVETNDTTSCKTRSSEKSALSSLHEWSLIWTGWGHSARVLDVSFAACPSSSHQEYGTYPILVSAGEDCTARIWSPMMSDKEITQPLRGHRCGSIWSVDVCQGIVITGGNDGCVKLYELKSRIKSDERDDVGLYDVPPDPPSIKKAGTALAPKADEQLSKTEESTNREESNTPKKTKKKAKPQADHVQSICGMEFYGSTGKVHSKLLIATKAGGLFSLDLASSVWKDYSCWSKHVVASSDYETSISINQKTGSCIGVHPSGKSAVIGTTEGWLVVSSICGSTSSYGATTSCNQNIAFQAPSYRPVQAVSFIDDNSLLVFYARGSVIWFNFDQSPTPIYILTLGTTGIPLSFAYDCRDKAMYIGDSRGSVAYFDLNKRNPVLDMEHRLVRVDELKPESLLATVHGKEHVTGITILKSTGVIISVGNDGCMHQFRRDASTGQLQKLISIAVPNASGLRHIWNVPHPDGGERVIIGGFYGNDFVMLDSIHGYEFLRVDTGGRQRRQDLFFRFSNSTASIRYPNIFGMAILAGWKHGSNSIEFHSSHSFLSTLANLDTRGDADSSYSSYSIGSPLHADINDICWIGDILLTGSNDCTVTLSKFDGTNFVSIADLPPHESCVRGVCSSRHQGTCLDLLVTCGGKLSMEFYLLDTSSSSSYHQMTGNNVSFLCSYRTLAKASIDHRMNAVRATPLFPREKQCHLVVGGDSDGNLHVCLISQCALPRRTVVGTILHGNGRPVLCLELLRFSGKILAIVGTTGGEVTIWVFPGSIDISNAGVGDKEVHVVLPTSPIFSYCAHQTGVNDISAAIVDSPSPDGTSVVVCTVGDDQSLSTCVLRFPDSSQDPDTPLMPISQLLLITESASASALKAVQLVVDSSAFNRIYTTGHDRQLTLWQLNISLDEISVKCVSSSPLGTDGSCIDYVCRVQDDGSIHEMIAVGGEGVEVQSFNRNILHAACKLHEANYLLITTGAGFSSDSGLQTYECAPSEYRDMCNPSKLIDDPDRFQQFWLDFTKSYLATKPHIGYELLDQWCEGGRLRHLHRSNCDRDGSSNGCSVPWWVYSSNVDGHFRLFGSFSKSVCEIHGSALEFRCACGIGYANGEPRLGNLWDQWNQKALLSTDSCKSTTVEVKLDLLCDVNRSTTTLLCRHCLQPMRPNVLMFHDTDENVLGSIDIQRERYQTWEGRVEDEVVQRGANLVILEMGCGVNVPAVRQESEEVILDCVKKVSTHENNNAIAGSACLIRINPKDAAINIDGGTFDSIPIASTAAVALRKIDRWLEALSGCET